jgi:hypothetical protein
MNVLYGIWSSVKQSFVGTGSESTLDSPKEISENQPTTIPTPSEQPISIIIDDSKHTIDLTEEDPSKSTPNTINSVSLSIVESDSDNSISPPRSDRSRSPLKRPRKPPECSACKKRGKSVRRKGHICPYSSSSNLSPNRAQRDKSQSPPSDGEALEPLPKLGKKRARFLEPKLPKKKKPKQNAEVSCPSNGDVIQGWKIESDSLVIDMNSYLGGGSFGLVRKATVRFVFSDS